MTKERLFRRSDEVSALEWERAASELGVDLDAARVLHEYALHAALGDPQRAAGVYLSALYSHVKRADPAPVPGRLTRAAYEASPGKHWTPDELAQLPTGKFTRVQIETTREDRLPGYDEWRTSAKVLSAAVQSASSGAPANTASTQAAVHSGNGPAVPQSPAIVAFRTVHDQRCHHVLAGPATAPQAGRSDLRPLARVPLAILRLGRTGVTDISPLANVATLEELELPQTAVRDVSPLAGLPALRRLNLFQTDVVNLTRVASNPALSELSLGGGDAVDLTPRAAARARHPRRAGDPDRQPESDQRHRVDCELPELRPLGRFPRYATSTSPAPPRPISRS